MVSNKLFGFGLDYQYLNDYPDGMLGLCNKYRDKLSHLSIVSLMSNKDTEYFKEKIAIDLPIIHHLSGIAPCDPDGPHLDILQKQAAFSTQLKANWCLEDIGIWSIGPYGIPYFAPPLFDSRIAIAVCERIKSIMEIVKVPFLAEIPSCSFVLGNQTLGEFFHTLVSSTGCKIVLDVSHVFSYSLATKRSYLEILESLPLEAAWEIHIAGGKISKLHSNRYVDTHSDIIMPEIEELLISAIEKCPNLKAITYEIGVSSTPELIEVQVERLTELIETSKFQPNIIN